VGGERQTDASDVVSWNRAELALRGTEIQTEDVVFADVVYPASDFLLGAGLIDVEGLSCGDGNVVRLLARGVRGSGPRENFYENTVGPFGPEDFGVGNRLEIVGTPEAFQRTNRDIDPPPPAAFFVGGADGD
jgi:hypothetical protein